MISLFIIDADLVIGSETWKNISGTNYKFDVYFLDYNFMKIR